MKASELMQVMSEMIAEEFAFDPEVTVNLSEAIFRHDFESGGPVIEDRDVLGVTSDGYSLQLDI